MGDEEGTENKSGENNEPDEETEQKEIPKIKIKDLKKLQENKSGEEEEDNKPGTDDERTEHVNGKDVKKSPNQSSQLLAQQQQRSNIAYNTFTATKPKSNSKKLMNKKPKI